MRDSDRLLSSERGFGLLFAIFALGIVGVLGFTMMTNGMVDMAISDNFRSKSTAFYAADGGVEQTLIDLKVDDAWVSDFVDTTDWSLVDPSSSTITINGNTITFAVDGSGAVVPGFYQFGDVVTIGDGTYRREIYLPPTLADFDGNCDPVEASVAPASGSTASTDSGSKASKDSGSKASKDSGSKSGSGSATTSSVDPCDLLGSVAADSGSGSSKDSKDSKASSGGSKDSKASSGGSKDSKASSGGSKDSKASSGGSKDSKASSGSAGACTVDSGGSGSEASESGSGSSKDSKASSGGSKDSKDSSGGSTASSGGSKDSSSGSKASSGGSKASSGGSSGSSWNMPSSNGFLLVAASGLERNLATLLAASGSGASKSGSGSSEDSGASKASSGSGSKDSEDSGSKDSKDSGSKASSGSGSDASGGSGSADDCEGDDVPAVQDVHVSIRSTGTGNHAEQGSQTILADLLFTLDEAGDVIEIKLRDWRQDR